MSGHEQDTDIRDSTPNSTGPDARRRRHGREQRAGRPDRPRPGGDRRRQGHLPAPVEGDTPPEQSAGGEEVQPDGVAPAAGYPSLDPRSADKPYKDA